MPETSDAPCGDLSLAYQVYGDGPVELVWAGSFASHVELYRSLPEFSDWSLPEEVHGQVNRWLDQERRTVDELFP